MGASLVMYNWNKLFNIGIKAIYKAVAQSMASRIFFSDILFQNNEAFHLELLFEVSTFYG